MAIPDNAISLAVDELMNNKHSAYMYSRNIYIVPCPKLKVGAS